ncbi:hypothetical protein [Planctopirus hydrillae]|uniref:hypothetical protein n=1 Tax=Planctopirus hydrillae TaxID=1841610 RepID=UPI0013F4E763|nr:hypothetical protein [Planctopirus hydrillae]
MFQALMKRISAIALILLVVTSVVMADSAAVAKPRLEQTVSIEKMPTLAATREGNHG